MKPTSVWRRFTVSCFAVAVLCAFAAAGAWAAQVTLAWDPNPAEQQVTGYSVYQDGTKVWSGPETTVTLPNVAPGQHSFTATATNQWGESGLSAPVVTPGEATPPNGLRITVVVDVTIKPQ